MRRWPRCLTEIHCFVELADGRSWPALIVDISQGGVGVEMARHIDGLGEFELLFLHGETPVRLPCTARAVRSLWGRQVIHTAFVDLAIEKQQVVNEIIEEILESYHPQSECRDAPPNRSGSRELTTAGRAARS